MTDAERIAKLEKEGLGYQRQIEGLWWRVRALETGRTVKAEKQIEADKVERADKSFTEIKE